jgi:hypothetical protein
MISSKGAPKGFWNVPHDIGRISLLRARGKMIFTTPVLMNIFALVLAHNVSSQT